MSEDGLNYSVGGGPSRGLPPFEKNSNQEKVYSREEQLQYVKLLSRLACDLLDTKGEDYAPEYDLFSAFEFVGYILDYAIEMGVRGQDLSFIALIAVKLSRIITTCSAEKINNESFEDTCKDGSNYMLLFAASKSVPGI